MKEGYNLVIRSNETFGNVTKEMGEKTQGDFSRKLLESVNKRIYGTSSLVIDASEIMKDYFPNVKADVFISHSHKDGDLALQIAAYLDRKGITSFVDSTVWKSCDSLIKKINNCYSRTKDGYFNYAKSIDVASKMYMILGVSLQQIIYRTPVFIFVNTNNSTLDSYITDSYTMSPWLFYELTTANTILEILKKKEIITESMSFSSSTNVIYPIDLSNFEKIDSTRLEQVFKRWVLEKT